MKKKKHENPSCVDARTMISIENYYDDDAAKNRISMEGKISS